MAAFLYLTVLAISFTLAAADPLRQQRVIGGSETTIQAHPYSAALLHSRDFINYQQECGGTIITNRAVLTAAHCIIGDAPIRWRIRVGPVYANYGGVVTNVNTIIINPNFNVATLDSDIAVIHSATNFAFSTTVRAASIAGANYNLGDNVTVTAIGWGATSYQGPRSETLRQVQLWTVNQAICRTRYADLGYLITDNMLCAGWLDVGGRGQCAGDDGSPVIHNNITVGVRSWGQGCGLARYPGVSTRVSRFTAWITSNS